MIVRQFLCGHKSGYTPRPSEHWGIGLAMRPTLRSLQLKSYADENSSKA